MKLTDSEFRKLQELTEKKNKNIQNKSEEKEFDILIAKIKEE